MGLFSSSKRTYVSSVIYNLAGDDDKDRPPVMKTLVMGSIISGQNSIADSIHRGLMNGTGMGQRKFFRWARNNFDLGLPTARIDGSASVPPDVVTPGVRQLLGLDSSTHLQVASALIDEADIDYWTEDYMYHNHPDMMDVEWSAKFDNVTSDIIIQFADEGMVDEVIPAPADLVWGLQGNRRLLFVGYTTIHTDPETQVVTESDRQFLTYRMGSGNVVLDSLESSYSTMDEFFPAIPIRLWNKSILDPEYETEKAAAQAAFKKMSGRGTFDSFMDSFEDNSSLGDIDFAHVVHGVPLNTKDVAGQEYIYRFFQNLRNNQKYTSEQAGPGIPKYISNPDDLVAWTRWLEGNGNLNTGHPLWGMPVPTGPSPNMTLIGNNSFRVSGPVRKEFDFRIQWGFIEETQHVGNGKTYDGDTSRGKLKKGEYWFTHMSDLIIHVPTRTNHGQGEYTIRLEATHIPVFAMFFQYDNLRYSRLTVTNLHHKNVIFEGHSVDISSKDALDDSDESGFLLPLHYPTLTNMSLVKSTQLSPSTQYLVLNSYEVVKTKWYQKGFFKIVFAGAVVALSIALTPAAGLAAGGGILGGNVAVGVALGASAATAAIVGAAVNAIAAMIVTSLISSISTELLGSKWGAVVGAVASFVAIQYGTSYMNTGTLSVDWGNMLSVDNLMSVTNSLNQGYQMWLMADTQDIISAMQRAEVEYEEQMEEIKDISKEILGMTARTIDPMMLTDALDYSGESSNSFLSRTLLTGSDIAELSFGLIENFSELSKELPMDIR